MTEPTSQTASTLAARQPISPEPVEVVAPDPFRAPRPEVSDPSELLGDTLYGKALHRLNDLLSSGVEDEVGPAFIEKFKQALRYMLVEMQPEDSFIATAEDHICKGVVEPTPPDELARAVSIMSFLSYYSGKFLYIEDADQRRQKLKGEIAKIEAILAVWKPESLAWFRDDVLQLSGYLRRRGFPLWLTDRADVSDCASAEDFDAKLALGGVPTEGMLMFFVGQDHIGHTPNVRAALQEHGSQGTMQIHAPTCVDGMWSEYFFPGGKTRGGAKEYVSRLNNVDAIDGFAFVRPQDRAGGVQ